MSPCGLVLGNGCTAVRLRGPVETVQRLIGYFDPWLTPCLDEPAARLTMAVRRSAPVLSPSGQQLRIERLRNENTGTVRYAYRSRDAANRAVFTIDVTGSVVSVAPESATVTVEAPDLDALYDDAKDILQRQILQQSMVRTHVLLHASAVSVAGRVIAFTGPKGAGKTTAQLHLVAGGGAHLVSADRLYVGAQRSGLVYAHGYPARSSVAMDTLARLQSPLDIRGFERDGSKVLIPLRTMACHLGTTVEPGGELAAVVLASRATNSTVLERVPRRDVYEALSPHWFGRDPIVPSWLGLFRANARRTDTLKSQITEVIAHRLPVVRMSSDAISTYSGDGMLRLLEGLMCDG